MKNAEVNNRITSLHANTTNKAIHRRYSNLIYIEKIQMRFRVYTFGYGCSRIESKLHRKRTSRLEFFDYFQFSLR